MTQLKPVMAWLGSTVAVCAAASMGFLNASAQAQHHSTQPSQSVDINSIDLNPTNQASPAIVLGNADLRPSVHEVIKPGHVWVKVIVPDVTTRGVHKATAQHAVALRHPKSAVHHGHHSMSAAHAPTAHRPTTHPPLSAGQSQVARGAAANGDVYWLSRLIEAEAGAESMATKIAVGDVIVNRVHSHSYPGSIKGVIFQQAYGVYEFTSVENGWINHRPSAASVQAARAVLNGHENLVPQALVFYNRHQTPANSWVRTQRVLTIIGDMTFAV